MSEVHTQEQRTCRSSAGVRQLLFAMVLVSTSIFAASFECSKARTSTERQICADIELSALDDELSRAYSAALARAGTTSTGAATIHKEQRAWIRRRDACNDWQCIAHSYQQRITELNEYGVPAAERGWLRETPSIHPESAKLTLLLRTVAARTFRADDSPSDSFCTSALRDMKTSRGFKAIEPLIRAASEDDPRLERWRACDKADVGDFADPKHPFVGLYLLGGGPYRTYRVEIDGSHANGQEDVIYRDSPGVGGSGAAGYAWVDIQGCTVRGDAPLMSAFSEPPPPGYNRLNALTAYANDVFALELRAVPWRDVGQTDVRYLLQLTQIRSEAGRRRVCAWSEAN